MPSPVRILKKLRSRLKGVRMRLYCLPESRAAIEDESLPKVLLTGGFGGSWNFGDILQLLGVADWYGSPDAGGLPVPMVGAVNLGRREDLLLIMRTFCAAHVLVFSHQPPSPALGLEEVRPRGVRRVHFYGAGALNSFWAQTRLPLLEYLVQTLRPASYVISGQQVEPKLASMVADHCRRCAPALVGLRDRESLEAMERAGVAAACFSGDDTWERLLRARAALALLGGLPAGEDRTFLLHMGLPHHVLHNSYKERGAQVEQEALLAVNRSLAVLRERYGASARPVLINAYLDRRGSYLDTYSSTQKTSFPELFPEALAADLPGLLMNHCLEEGVAGLIAECRPGAFLGTYYHPTLFFKVLGVCSYLFNFNEFYRQKAAGLDQPPVAFEDFLRADRAAWLERQERFVSQHTAARKQWLDRLAAL